MKITKFIALFQFFFHLFSWNIVSFYAIYNPWRENDFSIAQFFNEVEEICANPRFKKNQENFCLFPTLLK